MHTYWLLTVCVKLAWHYFTLLCDHWQSWKCMGSFPHVHVSYIQCVGSHVLLIHSSAPFTCQQTVYTVLLKTSRVTHLTVHAGSRYIDVCYTYTYASQMVNVGLTSTQVSSIILLISVSKKVNSYFRFVRSFSLYCSMCRRHLVRKWYVIKCCVNL